MRLILPTIAAVAVAASLPSAQCAAVADIVAGPTSSNPSQFVNAFGQELYFSPVTPTLGLELWKWSESTGAVLVADVNPGSAHSQPQSITPCCTRFGPRVFFTASSLNINYELWMTDGTAGGTVLVKEIRPGPSASFPASMVACGDRVFFSANDGVVGSELWVSDGTAAGTQRVADIEPGTVGATPDALVCLDDLVVFTAYTPALGRELYASDGTTAGTILLGDIEPGPMSSLVTGLIRCGDLVFFVATDSAGAELWKTDGTPAGTAMVIELMPGRGSSTPGDFCAFDDLLYFAADNPMTGRELYVTDGTAAGTRVVADIVPSSGSAQPTEMTRSGNRVFFVAWTSSGKELWVTDGTAAGTYEVFDINPGIFSSFPTFLTATGTGVCFRALHPTTGYELWFSDGTAAGTFLVCDIDPTGDSLPAALITCRGQLFFIADDPATGVELHHVPTPGAITTELGVGSLPDRSRLTVRDATPPVLGDTIDLVATGPAGHVGVLFLGLSAAPNPPIPGLMDGGCDWTGLLLGAAFQVASTAQPSLSVPLSMPANPVLEGAALNLQMVWANAGATPPLQLSNGVQLVLGTAAPH